MRMKGNLGGESKNLENYSLTVLFITMSVSFIVVVEPSPYDLLMVLFMFLGLLFSVFVYNSMLATPFLLVLIFILSNLISSYFSINYSSAAFYFAITFYLALSWFGFVCTAGRFQLRFVETVLNGYLIAACLSVLIGVLAYVQLIPFSDYFLYYDRVKATFKDPNVFGPFLVAPALYALYKADSFNGISKLVFFGAFLFLSVGVLLSFSRAAWGNEVLAVFVYLLCFSSVPLKKRLVTLFLFFIAGLPVLFYLANSPLIEGLLQQRLSLQGYDQERFSTQREAFETGIANPLGIGPGQSEERFALAPHSLYARLFTENGLLGFGSFLAFMMLSLYQSFKNILLSEPIHKGIYVVIFATLTGLVFNSIFIDTLHWRHFWLMLGLAWCPIGWKR